MRAKREKAGSKNSASIVILLCVLAAVVCAEPTVKCSASETKRQADKPNDYLQAKPEAIQSWRDMKFGLFVHWGPVSVKGTEISWSRGGQIPLQEYDRLYKQFNPTKFDADKWVQMAKAAGMKYIVITAKHHDGFCLWDSKTTDYDIMSTPFKHDIIAELADACEKHRMAFCVYYSVADWYYPHWICPAKNRRGNPGYELGQGEEPDVNHYFEYMKNQMTELLTNYGKVGVVWWDGGLDYKDVGGWNRKHGEAINFHCRTLQPDTIINNRAYAFQKEKSLVMPLGDFDTPEQTIGSFQTDRPWETCMTICKQWAWKPNDQMKSLKQCVQTLVRTVGGDGNFLFNVGPMPTGEIEPRQVERLKEMGTWLNKYGHSIYATRGGPFKPGTWGASTYKGNRIYVHVLNWQGESLLLPAIDKKVVGSSLLTGGSVNLKQTKDGITITIPKQYHREIDTIVILELDGPAGEIAPVDVVSAWPVQQKKVRTSKTAKSPEPETKQQRDARMQWWREARFGVFIHWGVYSVPAGMYKGKQIENIGEWIMHFAKISIPEYEQFAKQFNPVKFNADQWVQIAKNAGMKYIVITSKHHDGFCLWDSKVTDYDIIDASPFERDILKELSKACKKKGIKLCFYHSIMDWHHPDAQRPFYPNYNDGKKSNPNFARYVETYMKPQLKELIRNYGPLGVLWFDGEWIKDWTEPMGKDLYNYVRELQPNIIINNRVGKGRKGMEGLSKSGEYAGDFGTPEQQIPATGLLGVDWESCMTMNDTWGYKHYDHNWKSTKDLLHKLSDIASKGGNFLLNVGPTAEGLIPGPSVERLAAMGKWMKVNSESIYGTTASPLGKVPWGRCTAKPGKLYLHVFDWPTNGKLEVSGLRNKVNKAYLLADKKRAKLSVRREYEDKVVVGVPSKAPDPINTVVVVEIKD